MDNPKTTKTTKTTKNITKFNCEYCKYNTVCKGNFEKHLLTAKHKKTEMRINDNEKIILDNDKTTKTTKTTKIQPQIFNCNCGKNYKYIQGLYKHRKTCKYKEPVCVEIQKTTDVSADMVAVLMGQLEQQNNNHKMEMMEQKMEMMKENEKQNKEQMELLTNTIKDMAGNMGSNNTITNNTNQFNINMFLNEECKDAINMSDFVKSIQVSLDQLQYTTNNGLCKGITRVIMDNMNKLSKYERPLHCSDLKRETIYIKDNDKWEKDTNKDKLKKVIEKTSNKNYTALTEWTKENPAFMKQDDKQLFYAKSMSAMGKPITGVEDKIIKSICKDNQAKE
ncbi:hypothetical protein PGAG_00258 [Phaeocystis globosa virus 12T]|uniref:Multiple copy protein PGV_MIGE n=1 Tax=Phaeocystis globosa virus PgV-16T TaxID=3071227 RepID=A0AC59EXB8_9VIRU|nr:multiple copy protein PGV_MIGE [Phaeocystis globosa virus]AET73147.1 hypothetical protein PGAG_00258 [Phaeocystis globosa virus 12T]AET73971.1 hypothetical protein PGBG_00263 [Phaeocystis globosa virus 14T]AGM15608.1 multiple copy protein PGV_MIGE [Phaeocystis globosa virus PgV-16T]UYE94338.1 multiple copy protein [Phaeocystis globosa virus]